MSRYVAAATLARVGDAGAGVSMVLLAVDRLGSRGAGIGGLLVVSLMAPHLFGQLTGRFIDRARDPRRALAIGGIGYALSLVVALLVFLSGDPWAAAVPLLAAGACGPLLTGGLSSLTRGLGSDADRTRAVDVLTYGLAGTAGPAVVAAVAALMSPAAAVLAVAGGVTVASGLFLTLPGAVREDRAMPIDERAPARALLLTIRPLRRVLVTTVTSAAAGGALGIVAVVLCGELTGRSASGAWVLTAVGVGNLVGSAVLVHRSMTAEPVRASLALAAALGVGYLAVAVAPTFASVLGAGAVIGVLTAPWVTATLAARERHAPPGRRAEVFTALAGWKIAAASAGTAAAGAFVHHGPRTVMAVAAALSLVSVVVAWIDRDRAAGTTPMSDARTAAR